MLKINVGALQQLKTLSRPYSRDPNKPLSARRAVNAQQLDHPNAPDGLKVGENYWLINDGFKEWPIADEEFRFAYSQGSEDQPASSEGPVVRVGWTAMLRQR